MQIPDGNFYNCLSSQNWLLAHNHVKTFIQIINSLSDPFSILSLCPFSLKACHLWYAVQKTCTVKPLVEIAPNPKTQLFLISSCSCLCPIHWSQMLSWEWRCSWSSADRRCFNYIWVINNCIAYQGATYIRGFTVIEVCGLTLLGLVIGWHVTHLPWGDDDIILNE